MKTTIKLLFTMLLLLAISNVQAQSHTFATGWCKLAKSGGVKGESASLECQACNAKDKKEIEAKNVENKRRDDAIVAKAKAEKEAYENARKAKQVEDAKKANSGKVYINGNTNNANSIKTTKGTTKLNLNKENSKSKLFPAKKLAKNGFETYFILNELGDTISNSTEKRAVNWNNDINKEDIPTNVIIVQYVGQGKYNPNRDYYNFTTPGRYTLINSKGEELLEEKKINSMNYLGNDFFTYTVVNENEDLNYFYDYQYGNKGCGNTMVLFDFKLNKKYYFNTPSGRYSCFAPYKPNLENGNILGFIHSLSGKEDKYIINSKREYIKTSN